MKPVTAMQHRSYSRGRETLHDADLTALADEYIHLREVLEELQFLRFEKTRLEYELFLAD